MPEPLSEVHAWLGNLLQLLLLSFLAMVPMMRIAELAKKSLNAFGEGTSDYNAMQVQSMLYILPWNPA